MADYRNLSGAPTGNRLIKVVATASPGTLIHTVGAREKIFLFATNTTDTFAYIILEYGGTTSPNDNIYIPVIPKDGLKPIVVGLVLTDFVSIRAYSADAAGAINIGGYGIAF